MKKPTHEELLIALRKSVDLQSHYAELLNMYDGGLRSTFTADSWIERLRELNKYDDTERSPRPRKRRPRSL
jgi:hypothetical protein